MSKPNDFSQQSSGTPDDSTGADMARENLKKLAGAEMNPRATTDKLKAQGEGMAKKHGG